MVESTSLLQLKKSPYDKVSKSYMTLKLCNLIGVERYDKTLKSIFVLFGVQYWFVLKTKICYGLVENEIQYLNIKPRWMPT